MPCSAITPRILIHISSQANNACATWNYRELNDLMAREDLGIYKYCTCEYGDRHYCAETKVMSFFFLSLLLNP